MRKMKIEIEYETDEKDGGVEITEMRFSERSEPRDENSTGSWGKVHAETEPTFKQALACQLADEVRYEEMTKYRAAFYNGLRVTVEPGVIDDDPSVTVAESFAGK